MLGDRQASIFQSHTHTHTSGPTNQSAAPSCPPSQQASLPSMATPSHQAHRHQWVHVAQQMVCGSWQSQASH